MKRLPLVLLVGLVFASPAFADNSPKPQEGASPAATPSVDVVVRCTYRDTAKENRLEVQGVTLQNQAIGAAEAAGTTREAAIAALLASGYGTPVKPCLVLAVLDRRDGSMAGFQFDGTLPHAGSASSSRP